jgi:hypothetical protein
MAIGAARHDLQDVSPLRCGSGRRLVIEPLLLALLGAVDHPPLMRHQRLLRRGLGFAWWLRRHQRADLHGTDHCGTCLRPRPEASGETAEPVLD